MSARLWVGIYPRKELHGIEKEISKVEKKIEEYLKEIK